MIRRYWYRVALVWAFGYAAASPFRASAQSANNLPVSAALAVHVRLGHTPGDRTQDEAELHNLTGKTITAYKIALTVLYSDGQIVRADLSEDLLWKIALVDVFPDATFPGDEGFLGPNQTRISKKLRFGDRPGGIAPVRVEGGAVAIVYKDRTAVGDPDYIATVLAQRRRAADEMAPVVAEMDKILSDGEIRRAVTKQKNMPEVMNIPSAEKRFGRQLGARIESLNRGTAAERRIANDLRVRFYVGYVGGPLLIVQRAFDGYKAQQAAYAAGSTRLAKRQTDPANDADIVSR